METNFSNKLISITNGRNFRELGGYETISDRKIKFRKILESGHLADSSEDDRSYLTNCGVKYDIDSRSEEEVEKQPDRIPGNVQYDFNPVFSDDLTNSSKNIDAPETEAEKDPQFGLDHMLLAYEGMIHSSTAHHAYQNFFKFLLLNTHGNEAVLFYYTAGKDRTGFEAFSLLSSLGIPLETIKKDYLLTNITTKSFVENLLIDEKKKGTSDNLLQSIKDIQTAHPEYLNHTIIVINKNYGSTNGYLYNVIQLSNKDIIDLRRVYLQQGNKSIHMLCVLLFF